MPQMSARVEEFYNRVHSPRDGRFATSGTGGGHYRGRASGRKRPTPGNGLPLHIKDARSTVNKAFDAMAAKKRAAGTLKGTGGAPGDKAKKEAAEKEMYKRIQAHETRKYNLDVIKSSHGHAKERRWRPGEADRAPHKKMSVDNSTSGHATGKFDATRSQHDNAKRRKATTTKVPGRDSVLLAWSKKLRKNKNI